MSRIYFILCVLLVSCGNNPPKKNTVADLPPEEPVNVKEKLDKELVEGISKLIESGLHLKFPDIPLNESFIEVGFLDGGSSCDSAIYINYNFFDDRSTNEYYKGILNIDGYNVAIFDLSNFGNNYYNVDSLKQIPLYVFKPYPLKDIYLERFCVRDGKLIYIGSGLIPSPPD